MQGVTTGENWAKMYTGPHSTFWGNFLVSL